MFKVPSAQLAHFVEKNIIAFFHIQFFIIRTRFPTPKRVTRHCVRATQFLSKKCRGGGKPLATLSDPKCGPMTSRSRHERVTAPSTDRSF